MVEEQPFLAISGLEWRPRLDRHVRDPAVFQDGTVVHE